MLPNLVLLCGFCSEGTKRLLVYDYMLDGCLDHHLFRDNVVALNWRRRFTIGLHNHCDIKSENILLDGDFQPKVEDMGIAKLVGRGYSTVLTTMRGTFGYLALEWICGLPITPKVRCLQLRDDGVRGDIWQAEFRPVGDGGGVLEYVKPNQID
ncbi:hypothetical protein Taro_033000 [Colocasia esculenta]|uniref:Protein kinase domain-containing protein n=1 Tax=Colocasia esculenta TaxID=4460 RepID=A0A843W3I0_COLES|nr:hypothetical protein [Colocasia esculenta]